MKLLVIEDNHRIARHIKTLFGKNNIIQLVRSGEDGIDRAKRSNFDVIILDLGLPDVSGLEVCRAIRSHGILSPILVLTGLDEVALRVELLNSGADDYVTKPFNAEELVARVAAVSRRKDRQHYDELLCVGDLVLNRTSREVSRNETKIYLRRKEYDILEYLVANKGRPVSRAMILDHAWTADRENWNNTVDVHIKQLRDKVDRPFSYPLIKTAYGIGYVVDGET